MEKHSRPYKCLREDCKFHEMGFGYAGGLSRHNREVHRSVGAPSFRCPWVFCARHYRTFSRAENHREHVRRVHRGKVPGDGEGGTDGGSVSSGRRGESAEAAGEC